MAYNPANYFEYLERIERLPRTGDQSQIDEAILENREIIIMGLLAFANNSFFIKDEETIDCISESFFKVMASQDDKYIQLFSNSGNKDELIRIYAEMITKPLLEALECVIYKRFYTEMMNNLDNCIQQPQDLDSDKSNNPGMYEDIEQLIVLPSNFIVIK